MGKTALVVDDSTTIREMVYSSLHDAGFEAFTAGNGQEALDTLSGKLVDLIISDLNMPVMDGLTFLKQVRSQNAFKTVPILVLTTESHQAMKEQAKAAGATGWLVKPFNREMLLKVIARVVP
jgi:two-component system chemotaxis response regulator CheY